MCHPSTHRCKILGESRSGGVRLAALLCLHVSTESILRKSRLVYVQARCCKVVHVSTRTVLSCDHYGLVVEEQGFGRSCVILRGGSFLLWKDLAARSGSGFKFLGSMCLYLRPSIAFAQSWGVGAMSCKAENPGDLGKQAS